MVGVESWRSHAEFGGEGSADNTEKGTSAKSTLFNWGGERSKICG